MCCAPKRSEMRTEDWRREKGPPEWQIQAVKKLKRVSYIIYIYIYGSRSKVLNKNFNLGGTQPTLLYDFTSSLCGVTQGNPAKHKLGARFAQGWRKCFHVLSWYLSFTHNIYIYTLIHCMYVDFIIKAFFTEQRFQNMSIQQLQNWEIKLHFSRKLRASPAQAKKCIWVK